MNWGKGLAIGYISFAVLLGVMVYLTTTVNPELVTTDYYARELAFQDKIDARERAEKEGVTVTLSQDEQGMHLNFNRQVMHGTIELLRPSDSKLDLDLEFGKNTGVTSYLIPSSDLEKGQYSLTIEWYIGENPYYNKQNFYYQ